LISAGIVYRFIHKPMSPGRARLFADAAVKKYEAQRRNAPAAPSLRRTSQSPLGWLIGAGLALLAAILAAAWALHKPAADTAGEARTPAVTRPAVDESAELAQAAAALAANRLTEPAGDNALELYLQAQARDPADPKARAGLTEVHERLLARAENALLEERLDEAAAAIETARRSGVESGRIAFLTAQLAKSRQQVKATLSQARARNGVKPTEDPLMPATRADAPVLDAGPPAAKAGAAPPRSDTADAMAAGAGTRTAAGAATDVSAGGRAVANADAWSQLLKNANDRMQQDRLIEPANDNAKYYLLTLRAADPGNRGLTQTTQDLGARLVAKARRALALEQYDAARSWLDEAAAIGFTSADSEAVQQVVAAAVARRNFLNNVIPANNLTLVKSVQPVYPPTAELKNIQGWVELDFTVATGGAVTGIVVHAASTPGVFEDAAMRALAQWRYKPMISDSKPVPQRARIRIRFSLAT
jgi:TonB family protein